MKYVKVSKDGSIVLPREAQKAFPALSEIALWWKGDALILKRVSPFSPSEFAERGAKKAPNIKEIVKEVHVARREKKRD